MSIGFNNIKLRLTLMYSVILLLMLVIFHVFSYSLLSFGLYENLDDSLASDFAESRSKILQSENENLPDLVDELGYSLGDSVFIYGITSGEVIGNPDMADEVKTALMDISTSITGYISQDLNASNGYARIYIGDLNSEAGNGELLVVMRNSGYIQNALDEYRGILLASLPLVLLLAGASGYFLANRSLKPISIITKTAEKIDPSDLRDRIGVKNKDELGRLAITLNSLFDRIYGFIERQRRFTADASHELRAPLTTIKAETSLALKRERPPDEYRGSLHVISKETERLNTLVGDLLTLASMDSEPEQGKICTVNLSDLTNDILNGWEGPCSQKGIKLSRQVSGGITLPGSNSHFHRIIDNLIKNAIEAIKESGIIECSISESSGEISIMVTDTGIGIPQGHLENIFERFYRVNRQIEGNGLGLSIVSDTAKMYGGRISVKSEPGKGSVFTVVLPNG